MGVRLILKSRSEPTAIRAVAGRAAARRRLRLQAMPRLEPGAVQGDDLTPASVKEQAVVDVVTEIAGPSASGL